MSRTHSILRRISLFYLNNLRVLKRIFLKKNGFVMSQFMFLARV